MTILQISKIQHRSGNLIDLPQLDNAELGFATDAKRLFIGKTEGGGAENIEILTGFSPFNFSQITGSGGSNLSITGVVDGQILSYNAATNSWTNKGGNALDPGNPLYYSNSNVHLGNVPNVKVGGGAIGYILETDGTGNLSWTSKGTITANIIRIDNSTPAVMTVDPNTPFINFEEVTITGVQGYGIPTVNGGTYYLKVAPDFNTTGNTYLFTDALCTIPVTGLGPSTLNTGRAVSRVGSLANFAGGSNTSIQFNDSGILNGDSLFRWDKTTDTMSVDGNTNVTGNVNVLLPANPIPIVSINGGPAGTGQLISNVLGNAANATGLPPFIVKSNVLVSNLYVERSVTSDSAYVFETSVIGRYYPTLESKDPAVVLDPYPIYSANNGNTIMYANSNFYYDTGTSELYSPNIRVPLFAYFGEVAATGNISSNSNISANGNLNIDGNAYVGYDGIGNLFVASNANITGNTNITANANVTGQIYGSSNLFITANANITGNTNITGNANISSNLFVNNDAVIGQDGIGNLSVFGNITQNTASQSNLNSLNVRDLTVSGGIVFGNTSVNAGELYQDPVFYYDDTTDTLHVPNITLDTLNAANIYANYANANTANVGNLNVPNIANIANIVGSNLTYTNANIVTANGNLITYNYANIGNANIANGNITAANGNLLTYNYANIGTANITTANGNLITYNYANFGNVNVANLVGSNLTYTNANITSANITTANGNLITYNFATIGSANITTANVTTANGNLITYNYANIGNANITDANGANLTYSNANITNANIVTANGNSLTYNYSNITTQFSNAINSNYFNGGNFSGNFVISNSVTFLNDGTGDASGITYNGSVARKVSWNTVGAAQSANPTGTNKGDAVGISDSGNTRGMAGSTGSIYGDWTLAAGATLSATYADLAEYYASDAAYEPGTVVEFGGNAEVTIASDGSNKVAGVVSTNPAYVMNSTCDGEHTVAVALIGRVPVKVRGLIKKGDMMISGGDGYARPSSNPSIGTVVGKALENFHGIGIIEVVVGRL